MDGEKFDSLIKRFCTTRLTRKSALRGLVAGVAAAVTGSALTADDADARKRRKNRGRVRAQAIDPDCTTVVPSPTLVSGNPALCTGGFRVAENSTSGTITAACGCKIAWEIDASGFSFGPSGTDPVCFVSSIVVKGGPNANLYNFGTPGVTCANGLVAPNGPAGISHVDVCGVTCCVPKTCADVVCTNGPIPNGCGSTINCPCEENKCLECDAINGICKSTCDTTKCEACVNGVCKSTCDTTKCEACVNGICKSTCDPDKCEECVNGICEGTCPGAEGCTPGYFKNHPETFAQAGLDKDDKVNSVFTFGTCCTDLGNKTLLKALSLQGGSGTCGAVETLLRAAVAALLNSILVDYALTTAQVIAEVNTALASCNRSTILAEAKRLDEFNNSTCPCNNKGCPS